MTTSFTALPLIDLSPLHESQPSHADLLSLSKQLYEVFSTVGFAYLVNPPLSYTHDEVFSMAKEFFGIPQEEKMRLAKRTFKKWNKNTYRGYFPLQPGHDNLKEGFEMGPSNTLPPASYVTPITKMSPFNLTEANVWPPVAMFPSRNKAETLYTELQLLSIHLLSLLAQSLDLPSTYFETLMEDSISTLRFLHYPATKPPKVQQELSCTPHTDSGLLTLLHQDATGGLEVLNASSTWIPAPYVPNSVVVNIGDLMGRISGGKFVATVHRVRSAGKDRLSVPFFCEPGVDAVVGNEGERYGDFVLGKMGGWVEFQGEEERDVDWGIGGGAVEVGA